MATKISDTLSLAGGNLARPTRFSALIAPPTDIINQANSKVFDVLCKSIQIPETTMEPIEILIKGHQLKIPGRVNQEQTIELTMYLDEHHYLRQLFSDWIAGMDNRFYAITNQNSAVLAKDKNYFGNLIIKTRDFDETTNEPMNYLFEGCYPTTVSGPEFSSTGVGEVSEFTVTLAYYRFLSGNTTGSTDGLDSYLSAFGLSPKELSSFGSIGNTISSINSSIGAVSSAFNSVSKIF